jgi:hypothetical protein
MDRPVMFNGRLNKDEVETWLDLLDNASDSSYADRSLAREFLMLEESITFVSSLENKLIGGTSIFKDKTRLAMVLTSVVVEEQFRDTATYQIVKSSMPFFKTVAIRDVDAIVSVDGSKNPIGFPLCLELDPWITEVLKRIGFDEIGHLNHCSFQIDEEVLENPIIWNNEIDTEEVRELIWNQSKPMGLTNSLVWLFQDFALSKECLMTTNLEGKTVAVAGFWKLSDSLYVSPFVSDPERINWNQIAESIVAIAVQKGAKHIELPIIGEGQMGIIGALENWCSRSLCRKLSLLRKPL